MHGNIGGLALGVAGLVVAVAALVFQILAYRKEK